MAFDARSPDPSALRISEDVYVQMAEVRARSLDEIVHRLVRSDALEAALSIYAAAAKPLAARMGFRVIARVLSEKGFRRSRLRDEMTSHLAALRPRWRLTDPADLEFWVLECRPGSFRLGLRLTGATMRHRGGREVERAGALKPTAAAAMVFLAGPPDRRPLLDPTCGSGTILSEATAAGWSTVGSDLDAKAVNIAQLNNPSSRLLVADAARLGIATAAVGAVVANLPFGKRFSLPGAAAAWFSDVLRELSRVAAPQAAVILLAPDDGGFSEALEADPQLELTDRSEVVLRGTPTTLWGLMRA